MSTNRRFISFFLILIAILLFSCDNGLRVSVTSAQEDGRAYLFISTGDNSRTVFPEQLALDSDMSLSFELKGGLVGSGQTVLREWTATSSTAYVAMTGDNSLTVEAGEWNFTLEAKRNNLVILSAAINSMDIVAGVNKLSFGTMEENRTSGTGTVDVTVKLPADSGVSHVGTGVLCVENGGLDDTRQELTLETGSDGAPFFRYYRENVESGSYSLMIQLTQDKDPNVKYVFREAVQVAANLTSSKTCSISSLSTVYSVTYNLNTTGGTGSWKGNSIPQDFYNPYDILVLPVAGTIEPPTGYFFGGWYEDSSFSGNPVTMIGGGSSDIPTGAKSFYAKWTQELYVGGPMASDANDGGNVAAPLATIQAAVDKIATANDGSPYTILLMGDVRDSSSVAYVSGKNFSLVNIVPAATLNLTIKSNIDGTPRTIDAGRNNISTGRVMYVGANASVTLQDVIVTGGYVKDTSGGGVCVDSGGIFIMNDGIISDNYAGFDGGGVYVSPNAAFIMRGGSIKTNEVGAGAGNYSGGGGVYVNGGTFTMEDGEITQNNGLKNGGGVYVGGSGTLSMSGGEISSNTVTGDGGGVYVSADSTFTMTSGITAPKIIGNEAGGNGGGVYAGGTLNMNGGEISGNTATYNGGGIAVDGGVNSNIKASIAGGVIGVSGSPNTAESGGGIYLISGMVDISAADVSYNEATANGGGIYLLDGSVTLQGGTVSHNAAKDGGGVYVVAGATLEMTGGIISNNSSTAGRGGGINLGGTLSMTGGTISGNGSQGVYAISAQAINLGDSAVIAADNDIQLGNGKSITITSSLTGSAPVATISPHSYSVGLQVLSAGYGVTLSHEVGKFDLSPGASGLIIDNTGKLGNPTPVSTTEVLTKLQNSSGSCSDTFLLAPDTTLDDLDSILTELYSTYNNSSLYQITLDLSKTTITEFSPAETPPPDSTGMGLYTSMGLSKIILPATIEKINSTDVSKPSPFANVDPSAFTVECIDPNVRWQVTSYMMEHDSSGSPIYTESMKNETSTIESYYLTYDGSFRYVLEKI